MDVSKSTTVEAVPSISWILIQAKKCDATGCSETKKLVADRERLTYKEVRELVKQTFSIQSDFVLFYLIPEGYGTTGRYLPILSEWDLNTAVFVSQDHTLRLKVDVKPTETAREALEDWEILDADQLYLSSVRECETQKRRIALPFARSKALLLFGFPIHDLPSIWCSSQRERIPEELTKKPLSMTEFHEFLDDEGRLKSPKQFRLRVYQGSCEKRLRATVWPLLLDVFPPGMNMADRCSYLAALSKRYVNLRSSWCIYLKCQAVSEQVCHIMNSIRKDVIRTDRTHPFYAGDEELNFNLVSLFNILATYALYHPEVGYCQGMSDLASPLLVVMNSEALAYISFCALMRRLRKNFQRDGRMMTRKFKDLCELLEYYDPSFYEYLRETHADDLLFCYRWLLLEMKREFSFDDALTLMEVNWASLPSVPPENELELCSSTLDGARPFPWDRCGSITCSGCQQFQQLYQWIPEEEFLRGNSFYESAHMFSFGPDDSLDSGRPIYFQSRNRFDSLSSCQCVPACFGDLCDRTETVTEAMVPTRNMKWSRGAAGYNHKGIRQEGSISVETLSPTSRGAVQECFVDNVDAVSLRGWAALPLAVQECSVKDCWSLDVTDTNASPVALAREASPELSICSLPLTLNEIQEICAVPLSTRNLCTLISGSEQTFHMSSDSQNGCAPGVTVANSQHTSTRTTNCSAKAAADVVDSGFCESRAFHATTDLTSKTSVVDFGETGLERDVVPESGRQRLMVEQLGGGNPFLMFVCVALLLEHRNLIMERKMDFNDIAIFFDGLMKRHNVRKILQQAKILYCEYASNAGTRGSTDAILCCEQRWET